MNNKNETWSLFYETFEISLQLALYIRILETTEMFWCNFFLQIFVLGYSEFLALPFISCFLYHVLLVAFFVFHSFVDVHICLVS